MAIRRLVDMIMFDLEHEPCHRWGYLEFSVTRSTIFYFYSLDELTICLNLTHCM